MWHHKLVKFPQRFCCVSERTFVSCKTRNKEEDHVGLITGQRAWENSSFLISIWKKGLQSHAGKRITKETRKGVELKLSLFLLVCWIAAVPGACLLCYSTDRSFHVPLIWAHPVWSTFSPSADFQPWYFLLSAGCVVHCECGKKLTAQRPPKCRRTVPTTVIFNTTLHQSSWRNGFLFAHYIFKGSQWSFPLYLAFLWRKHLPSYIPHIKQNWRVWYQVYMRPRNGRYFLFLTQGHSLFNLCSRENQESRGYTSDRKMY